MNDPTAALVVSQREWASQLHRHALDHGGIRIKVRVMRPEDTLTEAYEVFVVDDITSFLTHRLVSELHAAGRHVLGVFDADDFPEGREHLIAVGVDAVIEASQPPDAFVAHIARLRSEPLERAFAPEDAARERSWVVAVGGPSGGPGVTEVAIALARASSGLLVDANDRAAAVAQRLGLPLSPNLTYAVDYLRRDQPVDAAIDVSQGFPVVVGVPPDTDWHDVRARDVRDLVEELSRRRGVVVDVGDTDGDWSAGLLGLADEVVAVGAPSPVGAARLVAWLGRARRFATGGIHVAVNRCPRRGYVSSEIERELLRVFEPETLTFLAEDRQVRHAAWQGEPVRKGRFRRDVDRLAAAVGIGP